MKNKGRTIRAPQVEKWWDSSDSDSDVSGDNDLERMQEDLGDDGGDDYVNNFYANHPLKKKDDVVYYFDTKKGLHVIDKQGNKIKVSSSASASSNSSRDPLNATANDGITSATSAATLRFFDNYPRYAAEDNDNDNDITPIIEDTNNNKPKSSLPKPPPPPPLSGGSSAKGRQQQQLQHKDFMYTEPDPFFDESMDDADERSITSRIERVGGSGRRSDAYLSCPCCLTTVCIDCQRHERYKTQFRAMFVQNCKVDTSSRLCIEKEEEEPATRKNNKKQQQGRRKRQQQQEAETTTTTEGAGGDTTTAEASSSESQYDYFYSVSCAICGTELAVYEIETEVYHFFHVVPSTA